MMTPTKKTVNPTVNLNEVEDLPADDQENELFSLVSNYFCLLGVLLYGYSIGHFGLSILWLYTASAVLVLHRQKNNIFKHVTERNVFQQAISSDEQSTVKKLIKYLPSWIHFPDTERAEWLNQALRQLWPFVDEYMRQMLRTKVEQNINDTLPDLLKGFRFASINFGSEVSAYICISFIYIVYISLHTVHSLLE